MMVFVAAIEGILIGLVYTEIFTCLALKLAHMLNKQLWQDHEACVINFTYPFECFGFMAYFWVLAFVFIPRATELQSFLADNTVPLVLEFNTTINMTAGADPDGDLVENQLVTVTTTASQMVELWMHDKRYKNQIGPMILLPVLVGVNIPMIFEYLLPAICVSWQRANRRTQEDREREREQMRREAAFAAGGGIGRGRLCKRWWRRCWHCWCTTKCCCSLCRMCRCCVLMCNCFMCDADRGTTKEPPKEAFPDYTDSDLARDLSLQIGKQVEVHGGISQRRVSPSPTEKNAANDDSVIEDAVNYLETATGLDLDRDGDVGVAGKSENKAHKDAEEEDEDASTQGFSLATADDIIVESMLDPLDLPNEYRKVCIISLLVCMWSGVNLLVPVIGWFALLTRFKFNFIRLAKYTRRPVPHKPDSHDATGGYRPWLEAQIFLSTVVTNLLFCTSTGQLEAWWALWDREACQPPVIERTYWKYPNCDMGFVSSGMMYDSTDALYDEASSEEAFEIVDPSIMSANSTCWQAPMPELNRDCPFVQGITDEWKDKSKRTSDQTLHRVLAFVVLENLQVMLLYTMIKWTNRMMALIE